MTLFMPSNSTNGRRRLLTRIVQLFGVTGLGFLSYPFFKVLMPGLSSDGTLEVDYSDLGVGDWKAVPWLGRRVIVFRRGLTWQRSEPIPLKDPLSAQSSQPDFARNEKRSHRDDVFIFFSNCTHLGCEVAIDAGKRGAPIECPCHQSRFDGAGRVYGDAVAKTNLEVPFYRPISANAIRLERRSESA